MSKQEIESIKKELFSLLDQLEEQQQKEFVWRCCVRALPFLSDNVSLKFWKYEDVDIDSIFNVLDLMSYGGKYIEGIITEKVSEHFNGTEEEKTKKIAKDLSWAFENAADIEDTFDQLESLEEEAHFGMPEYMEDKYPQSDDYFGSQDYHDLHGSILDAFSVVDILWASAQFFDKKKVSLQKVIEKHLASTSLKFTQAILSDLKMTIANQKPIFSIDLYQQQIETFEQAMRKIHCVRKSKHYKYCWNNNFEMNIDELKERIYYLV